MFFKIGTTSAPGSGSSGSGAAGTGSGSAGTGSGNANSCPPVDIMACQPSCLIRGQHGCVICSCAGKITHCACVALCFNLVLVWGCWPLKSVSFLV